MKLVLLAFSLLLLPLCHAQTSLDQIQDRLKGKPLFLGGQWASNHLEFDGDGRLLGKSTPVSFTLSGFDFESAKLKGNTLVLKGRRAGIELVNQKPKRVTLPDPLTISIAVRPTGDFVPALQAIFFDSLDELAPHLPSYWQAFAQQHLLSSPKATLDSKADGACSQKPYASGAVDPGKGGVGYPRLMKQIDPQSSESAQEMRYSGSVLVGLIVDVNGKPDQLCIRRAAGLGLDERALAAISQYAFAPAKRNGAPVAVIMDVAVNF